MGWLDTPENRRRQHLQMIATGNIRDIDRIHERNRRRGINFGLWALFILSVVMGWLLFNIKQIQASLYLFGFSIIMLIIIIFRFGWNRKIGKISKKFSKRKSDWEKLNRAPDWVHRKMKRRRKNIVKGDHYLYKREGNTYYRKLK